METPPKLPPFFQQMIEQQERSKKANRAKWIVGLIIGIFTIAVISQPKRHHKKASQNTDAVPSETSVFQTYIAQSKTAIAGLSDREKWIRQDALKKLRTNPLYKSLVDDKVVEQQNILVLQATGNSMLTENDSVFSINDTFLKKLKEVPGAESFIVNMVRLDMYGGVTQELLDVYSRYVDKFRISGSKGDVIFSTMDTSKIEIEQGFTLSEAMVIFHYDYPKTLDDFSDAESNGLTKWGGEAGPNYRYSYLNTKKSFNDYLKTVYPESKNYISYDLSVTAVNLYSDYDANEVAADDKYRNKSIAVTGVIESINNDVFDKPYVVLGTNEYFSEVQCSFINKKNLKSLAKGEQITVVGNCDGKVLTAVSLSDCKIF